MPYCYFPKPPHNPHGRFEGFKNYFTTSTAERTAYVDYLMDRDSPLGKISDVIYMNFSDPSDVKNTMKTIKGFRFGARIFGDNEVFDYASKAIEELKSGNMSQ